MASDKQIAANRLNAQKSCGPTSPEGLAKSSQNALKTGIDSKSEVMPCESREEYDELAGGFRARFAPATLEEQSFVDSLIRFEWLSRRYMAVEGAMWTFQNHAADFKEVGRIFLRNSDSISRANQRFGAARRGFATTLKQLKAAQKDRPTPESPAESEEVKPELASLLPFLNEPHAEPETGCEDEPIAA